MNHDPHRGQRAAPTSALAAAITAAALALLAGCAAPPPAAPLTPPAAMRTEGVPAIPATLVSSFERYSNVVGHGVVDWHPQRRELLIAHRAPTAATTQLWRLRSPLGALEPLTEGPDPVGSGVWEPKRGRYVVFARGRGGDEAFQLFRIDPETRATVQLTPDGERHAIAAWLPESGRMIFGSVPLDRTAQAGTRREVTTKLTLIDPMDPANPATRRVIAELPGGGWVGAKASPDEKRLAVTRYVSATESEVWLLDLQGPAAPRRLLPAPGEKLAASHFVATWSPDGRSLALLSDRASEFRELMRLDLDQPMPGALKRLSSHIPWDLAEGGADARGSLLAMTANVDGRDELRLFDLASGTERALPPGTKLPGGSVGGVRLHAASGEIAFAVASARGPAQVHTLDPATGRVERWTTPVTPPGLDLSSLPEPEVVRWKSFDGLTVSGILYRPPAKFTGKRPVLMSVHGGPEGQSKLGWRGRLNYLVQELGIAVLEPNVRGSTGYGKTFLSLDNGRLREDSVKDMGTAIDWIATQPDLDATRVVDSGGSYGGYMALAASVRLADRIAGAASAVGISNFVTFLERTESYRRDLRRVEYGDERDPAMRAFLESISPLNLSDNIKKPLLVSQGKNDPRVPWTESEQIVRKLQGKGLPVWYLLADNEGHGFARRENAEYYFATLVTFLQQTVLK